MQSERVASILIVDDKQENIDELSPLLHAFNIDLHTAGSVGKALEMPPGHDYALVLINAQVSDFDAATSTSVILDQIHTPVIMLTDIRDDRDIHRMIESGAADVLMNPVDPLALKIKVSTFLDLYQQKQLLKASNLELIREKEKRTCAEKDLIQARESLKQATAEQKKQPSRQKMLSDLAGGLAHEFNNLLLPIIGFSKMVLKTLPESSTEAGYLDIVISNACRAKEIVSQVRLLNLKRETKLEMVQLERVVDKAFKELEKGLTDTVTSVIDIQTGLRPVLANKQQIAQLIHHLCQNSVEAMPEGGSLNISVYHCSKEDPQESPFEPVHEDCVCLEISDTGGGMSEETREQIFVPFFTTKQKKEHSGLGLSVVLRIVEQCKGTINVLSLPDKGTTFRIYFPMTVASTRERVMQRPLDLEHQSATNTAI